MSEPHPNTTRRRRVASTEVSSSSKSSSSGGFSATIAVIVILASSGYLLAHNQVDEALGRTTTVVAGKNTTMGQVWSSVMTTFATDDVEEGSAQTPSDPGLITLRGGERVTTGSQGHTLATRDNDILRLDPGTTITVGEPQRATIIELLDGTLHVIAGERQDGDTLSIETEYLVATVKGTKFVVATTDMGTVVSVTEGMVSVRSIHTSEALDVVPGHTAIVSSVHGLLPTIVATPSAGGIAALEAAVSGTIANSNHHRR